MGTQVGLGTMTMAFSNTVEVGGEPSHPRNMGPSGSGGHKSLRRSLRGDVGLVLWVRLGEIFPNRIRAKVMGLATGLLWLAIFAVSVGVPGRVSNLVDVLLWSLHRLCRDLGGICLVCDS